LAKAATFVSAFAWRPWKGPPPRWKVDSPGRALDPGRRVGPLAQSVLLPLLQGGKWSDPAAHETAVARLKDGPWTPADRRRGESQALLLAASLRRECGYVGPIALLGLGRNWPGARRNRTRARANSSSRAPARIASRPAPALTPARKRPRLRRPRKRPRSAGAVAARPGGGGQSINQKLWSPCSGAAATPCGWRDGPRSTRLARARTIRSRPHGRADAEMDGRQTCGNPAARNPRKRLPVIALTRWPDRTTGRAVKPRHGRHLDQAFRGGTRFHPRSHQRTAVRTRAP